MKNSTLIFFLLIGYLRSESLLQFENRKIQNYEGQIVNLKGCNLGNWLQLEMWMFSYADKGYADQYEFIKTLEDRFGRQGAEDLMDIYRSNWIKNNDQVMKAKSGPTLDLSNQNLKVEKIKEYVYFYVNEKNDWVKIGELNIINWVKTMYIGLATLSHDNSQLTAVTYNNIHLSNQHGN